jgi:hypothetical protein
MNYSPLVSATFLVQSVGVCFSPCCAQRHGDFRDWLLLDFMFCARRGTQMGRPYVPFRQDSLSDTACFSGGLSFDTCARGVLAAALG